MGNKPSILCREKFQKLLSTDNTDEIKARILDICKLPIQEEDFITSFLPADIRQALKSSPKSVDMIVQIVRNRISIEKRL